MGRRSKNAILPGEKTHAATTHTIIASCLSVVISFAVVNFFVNNFDRNFYLSPALISIQYDGLFSLDAPPDILLLGDSSGLYGIRSEVLMQTLGVSARNASTFSICTPYAQAGVLRNFISQVGRPKAVVYILCIGSLEAEQGFTERRAIGLDMPYFIPLLMQINVYQTIKSIFIDTFRMYMDGNELKSRFLMPWVFYESTQAELHVQQYRNEFGDMCHTTQNLPRIRTRRSRYLVDINDGYHESASASMGLAEMAELSREENLHVFFALGPIDSVYVNDNRFLEYLDHHVTFLKSFTGNDSHLHMLSETPVYISESNLYDSVMHPSESGARYYTAELAAQLDSACTSLGIHLTSGNLEP